MSKDRRKRLLTLWLVAAVLTAGLLGTVDATEQVEEQHLTTGHTEFADASTTFDSCFAGLAGHLMQRVTWFNGQTLFTHSDGGDKHVYVTEHFTDEVGDNGDPDGYDDETGIATGDPSSEQLYRTDNTYRFTDENNPDKQWTVHEYFALRDKKSDVQAGERVNTEKKKVYVFVVETDDTITDPTLNKDYNFAMVIDTCRFHTDKINETEHEDGQSGESGSPWGQHEEDSTENGTHTHDEFEIDIWVGSEPKTLAGGEAQVPDERSGSQNESDGDVP